MPRLARVDQVATVFHRVADAGERAAHHLVVWEQFIQARHHGQRRPRRDGRQADAVEGVGLHEFGDVLQLLLGDQLGAVAHVDVAVVAQQDRAGLDRAGLHRVEHIAAMARGDVHHAHFAVLLGQAFHRFADQFLDVDLALADAAPADGFEVGLVDRPAESALALGRIAVDVVERAARIEAGVVSQLHAAREQTAKAQAGARHRPVGAAWRPGRQRGGKRARFVGRRALQVRLTQVDRRRRRVEALQDELADRRHHRRAVALAQRVVEEAGQHRLGLDRAAQPLEEGVLRLVVHHPVGARNQQLHGQRDRVGVGHHAVGGGVQVEQDVHRDRPRDERVALVTRNALRIVREELRLDVAVDEEQPAQLVHQTQAGAREGHVELDLEGRRCERQAAHLGRVVVRPGGDQHRAHALRDDVLVPLPHAVRAADVVDEGLHVAHRGREARAVAARTGRLAVAAGVPGEEVEVGQVELVDQVRHSRAVLVAAVEQQDGTASCGAGGRPMAVEQRDAVVRGEVVLVRNARLGHGGRFRE